MSDHIDPVIKKRISSTEWLYNVLPGYFDGMEFWEAISMREFLARKNAKRVMHLQEQAPDSDTYLEYEAWLNDIYKAIDFNEQLLKERRSFGPSGDGNVSLY